MHQTHLPFICNPFSPAPAAQAARRFEPNARMFTRSGSALITAIVFALIVALTLAGVGILTVSHYSLAHVEADSTAALDLAEAGINYELTKITDNAANADAINNNYQPASNIDAQLRGAFYVRCTDPANMTGAWNGKGPVMIVCTGKINGAQRTVSIQAVPASSFYIAYAAGTGTKGGQVSFNGENASVVSQGVDNGELGTDGKVYINPNVTTKPSIPKVAFDGPNAGWYNNQDPGGYSAVVNPKPVAWTSVTQKISDASANTAGGLSQTNDNGLATYEDNSPAIINNKISNTGSDPSHTVITLHGKPAINGVVQTANYYLTTLSLTGNSDLQFDNSDGPINIYYVAPTNTTGAGGVIQGAHSKYDLKDKPGHNVNLFSSSPGNLILNPNSKGEEVEMGIYAYDTVTQNGKTQAFGGVNLSDNLKFKGQIIADKINVYNNVTITGQRGYFDTPSEYYAFAGNWQEISSNGTYGGANQ